jgi:hypothetical protein
VSDRGSAGADEDNVALLGARDHAPPRRRAEAGRRGTVKYIDLVDVPRREQAYERFDKSRRAIERSALSLPSYPSKSHALADHAHEGILLERAAHECLAFAKQQVGKWDLR